MPCAHALTFHLPYPPPTHLTPACLTVQDWKSLAESGNNITVGKEFL